MYYLPKKKIRNPTNVVRNIVKNPTIIGISNSEQNSNTPAPECVAEKNSEIFEYK